MVLSVSTSPVFPVFCCPPVFLCSSPVLFSDHTCLTSASIALPCSWLVSSVQFVFMAMRFPHTLSVHLASSCYRLCVTPVSPVLLCLFPNPCVFPVFLIYSPLFSGLSSVFCVTFVFSFACLFCCLLSLSVDFWDISVNQLIMASFLLYYLPACLVFGPFLWYRQDVTCWSVSFKGARRWIITFRQSQACCFSLFQAFILS